MAKIVYSKRSLRDLDEIGDYIADTLKSPRAALNTVNKVQGTIDKLADFPRIGSLLSSVANNVDSDYRFLVCGKYLAFYRIEGEVVCIDRILYGRRDYLAVLLPSLPHEKEE